MSSFITIEGTVELLTGIEIRRHNIQDVWFNLSTGSVGSITSDDIAGTGEIELRGQTTTLFSGTTESGSLFPEIDDDDENLTTQYGGKWMYFTLAQEYSQIIDNASTTIRVLNEYSNSTSALNYNIVDTNTTITSLAISGWKAPLVIRNCKIDNIVITDCRDITLEQCHFDTSGNSCDFTNIDRLTLTGCRATTPVNITDCTKVTASIRPEGTASTVIENCDDVAIRVGTDGFTGWGGGSAPTFIPIRLNGCGVVEVSGYIAVTSGSDAVIAEGCKTLTLDSGYLFRTSVGVGGYAASLSNGGYYDFTGMNSLSTGDFYIEGETYTRAALIAFGQGATRYNTVLVIQS